MYAIYNDKLPKKVHTYGMPHSLHPPFFYRAHIPTGYFRILVFIYSDKTIKTSIPCLTEFIIEIL